MYAETVDTGSPFPCGSRFAVDPVSAGTRLVMSTWADVPDGAAVDGPATQAAMTTYVDRYVARVKALLEGPTLATLLPEVHRRMHHPDTDEGAS